MCVEIFNQDKADELAHRLSDCDCIRFSDGFWYKFTKECDERKRNYKDYGSMWI